MKYVHIINKESGKHYYWILTQEELNHFTGKNYIVKIYTRKTFKFMIMHFISKIKRTLHSKYLKLWFRYNEWRNSNFINDILNKWRNKQ